MSDDAATGRGSRLSRLRVSDRHLLAALAVLSIVKGLVWIALFPVFKIADEPSHFLNAQYRAEFLKAPEYQGPMDKIISPNAPAEAMLAWRTTNALFRNRYRVHTRSVPEEQTLREWAHDPKQRRGDGQVTSLLYPGVYYNLGALVYLPFRHTSVLTRIAVVRMLSALLGLVAVLTTFLAARHVMKSRALAVAAAVIVCLQPMESQMTAAVNNDAGVIGFSALVFYLQIRFLQRLPEVPSWRWGALLGLAALLDVKCKPQAYALLPGCAIVCGLILFYNWRQRRAWLFAAVTLLAFAVPLAPQLWALVSTGGGSMLPGNAATPNPTQPNAGFLAFLDTLDGSYKSYLFRSAFGQFGWLEYGVPTTIMDIVHLVYRIATFGLAAAFATRVVFGPRSWLSTRGLVFALGTAVFGIVMILYAEYRFRLSGIVGLIQGRNFLYVLPAAAVTVAAAFGALMPARFRTLSAATLVTSAFALHLYAILFIARNYYGP